MDNDPLYRALADGTRRRIIRLLLGGSCCVSAIARRLNISESAVSQHLNILRQAMLLCGEKRGRYMHYHIDRQRLLDLARDIVAMAAIKRRAEDAAPDGRNDAFSCSEETRLLCHGTGLLPMAPLTRKED